MKLISVNVGLPREVVSDGKIVTTAIFKEPVVGRVEVRKYNLDGDRQADPSVHGGADKAIYAYPVEHYDYWRRALPDMTLPFGMFGENLTTEGLLEGNVSVGDRFRVGTAEFMVTQPRLPCFKLALKFGREDIIKRFLQSGRTGFYFTVLGEGKVGAGDTIELTHRDERRITVSDVVRLYTTKNYTSADVETLRRAVQVEALPESWRRRFLKQIEQLSSSKR
jgi:MOSC domain-containing protein YiiM